MPVYIFKNRVHLLNSWHRERVIAFALMLRYYTAGQPDPMNLKKEFLNEAIETGLNNIY